MLKHILKNLFFDSGGPKPIGFSDSVQTKNGISQGWNLDKFWTSENLKTELTPTKSTHLFETIMNMFEQV